MPLSISKFGEHGQKLGSPHIFPSFSEADLDTHFFDTQETDINRMKTSENDKVDHLIKMNSIETFQ